MTDDALDTARDRACLSMRHRGALASIVMTLDADGTVRMAASHDESVDGSTIYRMVLTLGREFEREITQQLAANAAIH